MLLLGIDLGTSSVKVSVVDGTSGKIVATTSYPEMESEIIALKEGWAEQKPEVWWEQVQQAILKCHASKAYTAGDIGAIGIAYQMHGLVITDKNNKALRPSIIWCDSRAVEIGDGAFDAMGHQKALSHLLNSPGNFTASKLAWVKQNEPERYEQIHQAMLPGDYIALQLTGEATTTMSALSEGVFWDFSSNSLSEDVLQHFGFEENLFPQIQPLFGVHGSVQQTVAEKLGLKAGIPVTYKAGDQPNNALALGVLNKGEVAVNGGTSGVVYAVSDQLSYDEQSRVNSFAHVNHTAAAPRIGVLLCINGTGIFYKWLRNTAGSGMNYDAINKAAETVPLGADGLLALPFGNGAERMFCNKIIGAHFSHLDLTRHTGAHLFRAAQEGIAFSFRYGLDLMRANGMQPSIVRANKANLFLSEVFCEALAGSCNVSLEFYEGDGSYGAAIGAGIGAGVFTAEDIMQRRKKLGTQEPKRQEAYEPVYQKWKRLLERQMANS